MVRSYLIVGALEENPTWIFLRLGDQPNSCSLAAALALQEGQCCPGFALRCNGERGGLGAFSHGGREETEKNGIGDKWGEEAALVWFL